MRCRAQILLLSLVVCVMAQAEDIPESLLAYITSLEETVAAPPPGISNVAALIPQNVSRQQALADVNALAYLMNNAYSGREFFEKQGVNFAQVFDRVRADVAGSPDPMAVLDLENQMAACLSPLFDGHLSLRGHRSHRFYHHQDAYFSDILLREIEGQHVVVKSGVAGVSEGAKLTTADPEKVLKRTLSPPGQAHYLIGILSDTHVARVTGVLRSSRIATRLTGGKIPSHWIVGTNPTFSLRSSAISAATSGWTTFVSL